MASRITLRSQGLALEALRLQLSVCQAELAIAKSVIAKSPAPALTPARAAYLASRLERSSAPSAFAQRCAAARDMAMRTGRSVALSS